MKLEENIKNRSPLLLVNLLQLLLILNTAGSSRCQETNSDTVNNLSYDEVTNLILQDAINLKATTAGLSDLAGELQRSKDREELVESAIKVLINLKDYLASKTPNGADMGHINVSHGPYCSGISKNGFITNVILEILDDIKKYISESKDINDDETLKHVVGNATCEADELKKFVEFVSNYMNAAEFAEISGTFQNTTQEFQEDLELFQNQTISLEKAFEDLTVKKEAIHFRLEDYRHIAGDFKFRRRSMHVPDHLEKEKMDIKIDQRLN